MSDQNDASGKHAKGPSKDISHVLKGWDYEPGTVNVRRITGLDGQPKLQMRLGLGLFQMELTGRPDGQRPHGFESLLEYYESRLQEHRARNGTELGFALDGDQCELLRDEAYMYYQRYLSFFVLKDYAAVVRDTSRNLRVLDLCGKYAGSDEDRFGMEQYRPYITMMNSRAQARLLIGEGHLREALVVVRGGLRSLREFFVRFGHEEGYARSPEAKVLRRLARRIRRRLPVDPIRHLQKRLKRAIHAEDYEQAAKLRDELKLKRPDPSA